MPNVGGYFGSTTNRNIIVIGTGSGMALQGLAQAFNVTYISQSNHRFASLNLNSYSAIVIWPAVNGGYEFAFTKSELNSIKSFVKNGGGLVLMAGKAGGLSINAQPSLVKPLQYVFGANMTSSGGLPTTFTAFNVVSSSSILLKPYGPSVTSNGFAGM